MEPFAKIYVDESGGRDGIMCEADEYNQFAAECLKLADEPQLGRIKRKALIEMAITWAKLAKKVAEPETADAVRLLSSVH